MQPEWLPGEAISARLGAVWIPACDVTQFLVDTLGASPEATSVEHAPIIGTWTVTNYGGRSSVAATVEWGTDHADAYALVADALNLTPTVVYRTDSDGKRIKLEAETLAANDKRTALEAAFAEWVWSDPERAGRLEQVYNDRFNSTVLARWDGSHLQHLPGLSGAFVPHRHQLNAVWRHLADDRNVLLGHKVGAGKTATMVIAGQEMRRTGQITKPLYVVPNHMLDQFAAEFRQLYPMAEVLVATKRDLEASSRRRFVARCATGEWHAVVMTHATFGRIPVAVDTERAFLEAQQERFLAAADAARDAGRQAHHRQGHRTCRGPVEHPPVGAARRTDRRQQRHLRAARRRLPVRRRSPRLQGAAVRVVAADRHRPVETGHRHGHEGRLAAHRLRAQGGHVRHRHPGDELAGRDVGDATLLGPRPARRRRPRRVRLVGRHVRPAGDPHGARPRRRPVPAAHPHRRVRQRPRAAHRVPHLLRPPRRRRPPVAARPRPRRRPRRNRRRPLHPAAGRANRRARRPCRRRPLPAVAAEVDNMLKVCNDGRLASLDLRLVDRDQDPDVGKVTSCAARVAELWDRYRDTAYLDAAGQPSPTRAPSRSCSATRAPRRLGFNVYDELRDRLAAAGLDPARVRFIHEANTDQAKERLFNACRSGEVDVLIGSTEKMGVGTNIQARLVALHHLDAPWRPADIEQREGRILRHGNQNRVVHVVRYVTEGSFDPYMWQTLERKARFIAQVMSPADPHEAARSIEDLDTEVVLVLRRDQSGRHRQPADPRTSRSRRRARPPLAARRQPHQGAARAARPAGVASTTTTTASPPSSTDCPDVDTARRRHPRRRLRYPPPTAPHTTTGPTPARGCATPSPGVPARPTWRPVGPSAASTGNGSDTPPRLPVRHRPSSPGRRRPPTPSPGRPASSTRRRRTRDPTRLERHLEQIGDRLAAAAGRETSVDQLGRGGRTLGQPFAHAGSAGRAHRPPSTQLEDVAGGHRQRKPASPPPTAAGPRPGPQLACDHAPPPFL